MARDEAAKPEPSVPDDAERALSGASAAPADAKAATAEVPEVDLSTLPSLESITATTDIRPFLAPGIPTSLRHAALRRAWSADPTIRDFVGLSENAWDFTAPDGVPGFGPIGSPEEVQRLLAQLMGEPQEAAEKSSSEQAGDVPLTEDIPQVSGPVEESVALENDAAAEMSQALQLAQQEQAGSDETSDSHSTELLQHNKECAASQQSDVESQYAPTPGRRQHGRALPE